MAIATPMEVTIKHKRTRRRRVTMPEMSLINPLAETLYRGGLTPNGVTRWEHLAARIVAGAEVGLGAIASVNCIMVVNGKACIYGDAGMALIRASGLLAFHDETVQVGPTNHPVSATCVIQRVGEEKREFTFSYEDAVTAKLWGKKGPWTDYPGRQLTWRARWFAMRDVFPDVLLGLGIFEEQADIPVSEKGFTETTVEATEQRTETDLPITDPQLLAIADARAGWLVYHNVDAKDDGAVKFAWGNFLNEFGVKSARELTGKQADAVIAKLKNETHQKQIQEVFDPHKS